MAEVEPGRHDELRQQVDALDRRLAALEQAQLRPGRPADGAPENAAAVEPPVGAAALPVDPALDPPRASANRMAPAVTADDGSGQVSYSGQVNLHGSVVWDITLAAGSVLQLPNSRSTSVLAGLGHPTRAALVRRLLAGPATTAELQVVVDGSSTGQLYHHLRTLTGCGLAEQDGRSRYRVPPTAVVPALVLLAAAGDIAGDLRGAP